MLEFYFAKTKYALRAIVLLGVFLGLLVSSGEGVRLFPFPNVKAETRESVENQNKIPHQFNLHRFGEERNAFHAESFHGKFSPHLTNGFKFRQKLSFKPKNSRFELDNSNRFAFHESRRALNNRGKRAPPFFQ
ncbi:MAG TPA: hypothetical protein PKY59_13370 [Pyrinomonadaceae bacterium]|nr:hypothetical protein [Pyrinomonadaceae bacterium]